ncbi:aspartic peptidase A1 [Melampsora larici-populina 98AG31]|uniref:Aspartic peptidase A1 n=1 Tax=Melampsora larici-populina (strain 98AG31 / pathotype 3-4-7) TaxID=747676 RepID=F4REH0_MELLP|nr:aspartic peptidase A1 [Melampsora larici-populina 98AG31]EGG09272.1 aspartic peptidase A1 [Melampsora larici-populina 98AG31]
MKTRWIQHFTTCVLLSQSIQVRSKVSIPLTNAINLFTVPISIGDPSTIHHLGIDTGSLVTWCGAITPYVETKSTVNLNLPMQINYGFGDAEGVYVNDTISFKSEDNDHQIIMPKVTIGKISSPVGFDGYDGLIGLNPVPWESDPNSIIETQTVMVHMWKRGLIQKNMFAVSGKPTKSMKPEKNGMITFGGYEPSLFVGELYWYDCYSGSHWDWTASVRYGETSLSSGPIRGMFDTGFTIGPALSPDLFKKYINSIPGARWDSQDFQQSNPSGNINRHLLKIPKSSIHQMKDLCFKTQDFKDWCFTPEAQLIPENVLFHQTYRYSFVSPFHGTKLPSFKFGMKGHERFYVVYDVENYKRQHGRKASFEKLETITQKDFPRFYFSLLLI